FDTFARVSASLRMPRPVGSQRTGLPSTQWPPCFDSDALASVRPPNTPPTTRLAKPAPATAMPAILRPLMPGGGGAADAVAVTVGACLAAASGGIVTVTLPG